MLGGLALKWKWKERVGGKDKDAWKTRTPNLVMGSNVQVVWESSAATSKSSRATCRWPRTAT